MAGLTGNQANPFAMRELGLVPRYAVATFVAALLVLGALAAAALVLEARSDLRAVSDRLESKTQRVADIDPTTPTAARAALTGAGHSEILSAEGASMARTGADSVWQSGGASPLTRLAAVGLSGTAHDGAFEIRAALPSGSTLVLREVLPSAHGGVAVATLTIVAGLVVLGAAILAAVAALIARGIQRRLRDLTHALEAVGVSQRQAFDPKSQAPEWVAAGAALTGAAIRTDDFRAAAEARFDSLASALTPLPIAAAARTPSGATLRNAALDSLAQGLNGDASLVNEAIAAGLTGSGAVARRLPLNDGRTLDVDAWAVPGGRVVTIADRTEHQRLERLRARLAGGAMRSLRPPIGEIRSAAAELFRTLPGDGASQVQRILRSADRLDRLTRALLRGGAHDPTDGAVSRKPVGLAGLLWDAAREWDMGLRPRALRVDLDLEDDLPVADTDPSLVEEILGELVENAAKFSRRGATVTVSARSTGDGAIAISVRDSGEGFSPEAAENATQFFYRGPEADALPGSGLGLGVAAALATRIDGRLSIEPGPGGRVTLVIPAAATSGPRGVAA
ncbi:MAG: HAMP domain-containing histidine kinase [Thermoleophilia bacterium]|nr:HAMP domain-containing histidine kinase [Thermoleophilia bacterium]